MHRSLRGQISGSSFRRRRWSSHTPRRAGPAPKRHGQRRGPQREPNSTSRFSSEEKDRSRLKPPVCFVAPPIEIPLESAVHNSGTEKITIPGVYILHCAIDAFTAADRPLITAWPTREMTWTSRLSWDAGSSKCRTLPSGRLHCRGMSTKIGCGYNFWTVGANLDL